MPKSAKDDSVRGRIMAAAMSAFMEQGYTGTSTLQIATRAKVSKRDIYAEFGSKQAVLEACIADRSQRMTLPSDLPQARTREEFAKILSGVGKALLREISDPVVIAVFRLAIAEAIPAPEVAQTLNAQGRQAARTAVSQVVRQAQDAKLLGAGAAEDMADLFFALMWKGLMLDLILGVAATPDAAEIDRRVEDAAKAFLILHPAP